MIIAVDIDGTVADLAPSWYEIYNQDFDDDLTNEKVLSWDTHLYCKGGKVIYQYLKDPSLYARVKPIEGALAGIRGLRLMGHRIIFVTSTVPEQAGRKYAWLLEHEFLRAKDGPLSDFVEAHDKSLIRADLLIDDGVHNLESFIGYKVLYGQPHNATCKCFNRAEDWREVVRLVSLRSS